MSGYGKTGALNINWGTEFDDGVRVGPSFPNSSKFKQYGQGGMLGALGTYSITALAGSGTTDADTPEKVGNFIYLMECQADVLNNTYAPIIVNPDKLNVEPNFNATENISIFSMPGYYKGEAKQSAQFINGFVLDYARCLFYSFIKAASDSKVTIDFTAVGFDMYGQPMMEQVSLKKGEVQTGKKAFQKVVSVYISSNVVIPRGYIVGVSVSNKFGLPVWTNDLHLLTGKAIGFNPDMTVINEIELNINNETIESGEKIPTHAVIDAVDGLNMKDPYGAVNVNVKLAAKDIKNVNIAMTVMYYTPGFDNTINQESAMGLSDGNYKLGDKILTLPVQPIIQYLPLATYTDPSYPNFGASFTSNTSSNIWGNITPKKQYPILPNTVMQYGLENYWNAALAQQLTPDA